MRAHRRSLPALAALLALAGGPAGAGSAADYDQDLCGLAQRMLLNAEQGEAPFTLEVLRGESNGFHTIQMNVEGATRTVVIATTAGTATVDGAPLTTHVACKLVDRNRVNDVLGMTLGGPARSCRDVNEHTYQVALAALTPAERGRYAASGRPLRFGDDYLAATGAEWLPSAVEDHISTTAGLVTVRAPAVVVPWNPAERNFYQGTHHCKLITRAAMERWMRTAAFTADGQLVPGGQGPCTAPTATTSTVGSCLFYFAPARGRYCQDYSGSGWTAETARAECGRRHASAEALQAAANRYAGAGGVWSDASCAAREDREAMTGTCVFHCRAPDETLWHPLGQAATGGAAAAMMSKACDLYLP
jgi:hypothetical protein